MLPRPDTVPTLVSEVRINLPRDLDRSAAFDCNAQLRRALTQTNSTVALGCADIRFVDSGGLRFLLEASRLASAAGVRLTLNEPSAVLVKLVRLAGVSEYLNLVDDRPLTLETVPDDASVHRGHSAHWFPVAAQLER